MNLRSTYSKATICGYYIVSSSFKFSLFLSLALLDEIVYLFMRTCMTKKNKRKKSQQANGTISIHKKSFFFLSLEWQMLSQLRRGWWTMCGREMRGCHTDSYIQSHMSTIANVITIQPPASNQWPKDVTERKATFKPYSNNSV